MMAENRIEHPWMAISHQIDPAPLPTILKWDTLTMQQEDGTLMDVALLTMANIGGVKTAFLAKDDLKNLITNAQEAYDALADKKLVLGQSMPNAPIDLNGFRRH